MKYLMLVCTDPALEASGDATGAEPGGAGADDRPGDGAQSWSDEMDGRGVRLMGDITPHADATTVRVRGGEVLLTDGPYVETNELIAGFDVLECADLDEAVAVAAAHPMARAGVLELRPFWTP